MSEFGPNWMQWSVFLPRATKSFRRESRSRPDFDARSSAERGPVTDELVAWNPRSVSSLSLAGRPRTRRRERPMNGGPHRFESLRARPRAIRPGSDHQVPGRTASHRAPAAIQPSGRAPRGRLGPPRVRRRPCCPRGGTRSRRTSASRRSPIDPRALSEPVRPALPRTSTSPPGCDRQ